MHSFEGREKNKKKKEIIQPFNASFKRNLPIEGSEPLNAKRREKKIDDAAYFQIDGSCD